MMILEKRVFSVVAMFALLLNTSAQASATLVGPVQA